MDDVQIVSSVDANLGAVFVGVAFSAMICGVGLVHANWYFARYPEDSILFRCFVAATWAFSLTHQILISHALYTYAITNFNNPPFLDQYIWSLDMQILFEGVTALFVQSFYIYRIWKLSKKSVVLTGLTASLVAAKFILTLVYVIQSFIFPTTTLQAAFSQLNTLWEAINAVGATSNIGIGLTMCWVLGLARTGSRRTERMLMRMMLYTVNTGLLITVTSLLTLLTSALLPYTLIYGTFYFLLPGLYITSMLSTLNARHSLSGSGSSQGGQPRPFSLTTPLNLHHRLALSGRLGGGGGSGSVGRLGRGRLGLGFRTTDPSVTFLSGSGIHVHRETVTTEPNVRESSRAFSREFTEADDPGQLELATPPALSKAIEPNVSVA